MKESVPARTDKNAVEATVSIRRPVQEVFSFYRDFSNLPKFLGDVMAVERIDSMTSRWTVQGPLGLRAALLIRVTEEQTNRLIRYETVAPPGLRTHWEVQFVPRSERAETEVREVMSVPLGRVGNVALALLGKFPAEETASNLHRLKEIMETGRVTDRSYSVTGKFDRR